MRILAIRGENLASLAGPFEVDLEAEPIRSAGIFAITGPTGAGKTTLFDAVCLALFDRLPRMDSAERGASVGGAEGAKQIQYDDVRGILRHGMGSGFAEVDFVGQDHRRYRARWEVKRARIKASGNLQPQKIMLTDLEAGLVIGDKKTDTLQQIEKRIGLTFDQFRRSVLLAQGDFDTFINSGAKDRAALLERITGTEIYAQISQVAFARAKQKSEALAQLEKRLGEYHPLSDEDRASAEKQLEIIRAEVGRIEILKVILAKGREWHERKSKLFIRVYESEADLEKAETISRASEPDRTVLSETRKAFSLRAELEAAQGSRKKLELADANLKGSLATESSAIIERDRIIADSEVMKAARDEARKAYYEIGLELDKAQKLDALIESADGDLKRRQEIFDGCLTDRNKAQETVRATEQTLQILTEQCAGDNQWLAEQTAAEELAHRIEEVVHDLKEWCSLESEIKAARKRIETLREEVTIASSARQEKERFFEALQLQENGFTDQIAARRADISGIDKQTVETKRDAIANVGPILDQGIRAAEDALKARDRLLAAEEEKRAQELILHEANNLIVKIDGVLPAEIARLEEARRSLLLSEAAGSEAAEHLRLKLQEGEPCPVCGSAEHPMTEVDRVLKERVDGDRRRVADLEEAVSSNETSRIQAESRVSAAKTAIEGITKRRAGHQSDSEAAQQIWKKTTLAIPQYCEAIGVSIPRFADDLTVADAAAPMILLKNRLDQVLIEVKGFLKQISDAEADVAKLSSEREGARTQMAAAANEMAQLKESEQAKSSEIKQLGFKVEGFDRASVAVSARIDKAVSAVFPDWKDQAPAPGEKFSKNCRSLAEQWQRRKRSVDEAIEKSACHEADLKGYRATLSAADIAVTEAEKRRSEKETELAGLREERAGVIGGRPAKEVRTEYQRRSEGADTAFNEVAALKSPAERLAAAKSSEVVSARQAAEIARTDHESAERFLSEKLHSVEMSREAAEGAIAKGESWIQAEQIRLDTLRESVITAIGVLKEAKGGLLAHDATDRPEQGREEIEAALLEIQSHQKEVSEELLEKTSILRNDDQARSRVAEIKNELDQLREKARVWAQLNDLIGSVDGSKFRRFAQSLTLSHLILLANRHLSNLQPRYELQCASGADLALQIVDHNMADEIRGVHNLSGGERFLVSLALALGLASMSSGRGVRVESLFIDEGFGALDSNSLAMAISVLEQLQATGRRVGVISHVEELKERIAVRVEIMPLGGGRSSIRVLTA
ncbi:MAG: AAA family ATPase [Candidatus Manganitrophaceae bacterium]